MLQTIDLAGVARPLTGVGYSVLHAPAAAFEAYHRRITHQPGRHRRIVVAVEARHGAIIEAAMPVATHCPIHEPRRCSSIEEAVPPS